MVFGMTRSNSDVHKRQGSVQLNSLELLCKADFGVPNDKSGAEVMWELELSEIPNSFQLDSTHICTLVVCL